ncbi:MAG: galactokinase [Verrucomicrobiae bacterium]|nr:galactokinase [Verrucomicrobiae bacterium]
MYPRVTASAPGRAELLGNHTDYNQGLVMAIAVDRVTRVNGTRREDGRILLRSLELRESAEFENRDIRSSADHPWANYVLGVVGQLHQRGEKLGGFELEIGSSIPMGSGLSSSAALEVATLLALQKMFGFRADRMETAKIAQAAENRFVGVQCGLLDQISSLFGRRNHAVHIDCRSLEVGLVSLPEEVSFVIAHTNVKHRLVSGEYNERRQSCEEAARRMHVPALRDADETMLRTHLADTESVPHRRAAHVIGENARVAGGVVALRKGRVEEFGRLMFESHRSSIHNFENSCPELDVLVEAAAGFDGCLGARLSGGGFGGATINLVRREKVRDFAVHVAKFYRDKTGISARIFETQAGDGAQLV